MNGMGQGRVVEHAEWDGMRVPDIYFTRGYHESSGILEPDYDGVVLVEWSDAHGVVRLPLLLRTIEGSDYLDSISAYEYGGPWIEGDPDLHEFFAYLGRWARENRVVCSFIRFHPLIHNAERIESFIPDAYFPLRQAGVTFGWELAQSRDLVAGMSKQHRRKYRKAVREGVEARVTVNPENLETFKGLYALTMERLDADSFYRFSDDYWQGLLDHVGESVVLVEAVHQDEVVAAILMLAGDHFINYHLAATADAGRTLGASVFCNASAALWAQDQGFLFEHMGGGPGGESGTLLPWKRDFNPSVSYRKYHVVGLVHDEEAYSTLSRSYPDMDFFPPWRAR